MKPTILAILLCAASLALWGQETRNDDVASAEYTREDSLCIVRLLQGAVPSSPLDLAKRFLGVPYVAHTLDVHTDTERLIVNTQQLDCTTLVETVCALWLCHQNGEHTFADYTRQLERLRYQGGVCRGYVNRLHYFSDWIRDNQARGHVNEIQVEGRPFTATQHLNLCYMSTHPQAYRALRGHPERVKAIRACEQSLSGLSYAYIPKKLVANSNLLRPLIHDGDILAITCNKPGLDIAHLGFAVWMGDGLHLLNASQIHHKVVLESMTLAQYLSRHPTHTGIRVVRLAQR